jgi:hypothetical protein
MDIDRIKERLHSQPFRSFSLETTGGAQIVIKAADHLFFAPEDRKLIIAFDPETRMHLLQHDQIASLSVDLPE